MTRVGVLAIGRSGLLYDAVRAVASSPRYRVAAVITDEAYDEYDVGVAEFASLAAEVGAEFMTRRNVSSELVSTLVEQHDLQIGISANWRFLIPGAALALLRHGVLNLHLGRLPDYKGNATANWAILNDEPSICADVHRMAAELDAGDVLARATLELGPRTYVGDVLDWSRARAPELFLAGIGRALDAPEEIVVPGSASGLRCYPRLPRDGQIDWARPAEQISRLVRASSRPYPGAFTHHEHQQVRIWRASVVVQPDRYLAEPGQVLSVDRDSGAVDVACGRESLRLEEIDVDGQPARPADALRGIRARLGALQPTVAVVPR